MQLGLDKYIVAKNYTDPKGMRFQMATDSFRSLWQSINGPDSWHHNPWVIAYTYQKCAKPSL